MHGLDTAKGPDVTRGDTQQYLGTASAATSPTSGSSTLRCLGLPGANWGAQMQGLNLCPLAFFRCCPAVVRSGDLPLFVHVFLTIFMSPLAEFCVYLGMLSITCHDEFERNIPAKNVPQLLQC